MSWPLILGIAAGVIAADLYSQKIKRDAKKEETDKILDFKNKLDAFKIKEDVILPDELKKVDVKKIKE